jgi:uncharacterized membrane-anchored protein
MGDVRQIKPGVWDRSRGFNWPLVAVLVGCLLLWLVLAIAVVRALG